MDVGSNRDEHIGHAFFGRLGSPMPSVIASVWSLGDATVVPESDGAFGAALTAAGCHGPSRGICPLRSALTGR